MRPDLFALVIRHEATRPHEQKPRIVTFHGAATTLERRQSNWQSRRVTTRPPFSVTVSEAVEHEHILGMGLLCGNAGT